MRAKNNLAKIRQKSGLSVVALAAQVGVRDRQSTQLKRGATFPIP